MTPQSGPIDLLAVDDEWITVGDIEVRDRAARGRDGRAAGILYIHGAGWVFGGAHTHDRLVRELAVGTGAAVVFPEYSLSPEPATRSRSSRSTRWRGGSPREGASKDLDPTRLVIAGDSVGGNMAAA